MDWLKQLNATMDYIESSLDDEIDYEEIERLTYCSINQFQRIFSLMSGISMSEYIRRRRLSKAAMELKSGQEKVIDIALKYGYESPTSFTRAFKNIHEITPSQARSSNERVKAFPPIRFNITIKGAVEMNFRIVEKDAFRTVGFKFNTTMENEKALKEIPKFWAELWSSGNIEKVHKLIEDEKDGLLGICVYEKEFDKSKPIVNYFVSAITSKEIPEDLTEYIIPKATWAIFDCVGSMPESIQKLQKEIFTQWLPSSGYKYAKLPDIEVYFDGDTKSDDYRCEVWLPIVKD